MVDRIGVEVVSNWEQSMLHTKTNQQLFPRWRISVLTSSKVFHGIMHFTEQNVYNANRNKF